MEREPASRERVRREGTGTIASHRFLGGHTWMASMRGDAEHLRRLQAKLEGVASIDVAGALTEAAGTQALAPARRWRADRAGHAVALDVVIRNLLVGHRFPGGVLDIQDTWIEVEVADAAGKRLAAVGARATRPTRTTRTRTCCARSSSTSTARCSSSTRWPRFRTQIATQTLAPREAQVDPLRVRRPGDASRCR